MNTQPDPLVKKVTDMPSDTTRCAKSTAAELKAVMSQAKITAEVLVKMIGELDRGERVWKRGGRVSFRNFLGKPLTYMSVDARTVFGR